MLYPGSSNAYDSLGEAYADRGRKDDAIRSYKSPLELNPENANAKAALERLSPPSEDPVRAGHEIRAAAETVSRASSATPVARS